MTAALIHRLRDLGCQTNSRPHHLYPRVCTHALTIKCTHSKDALVERNCIFFTWDCLIALIVFFIQTELSQALLYLLMDPLFSQHHKVSCLKKGVSSIMRTTAVLFRLDKRKRYIGKVIRSVYSVFGHPTNNNCLSDLEDWFI